MDFKQLRCFVAAAELESFGPASTELHLAPSALSRHVANLERQSGVALFERRAGGRAQPTPAGLRLLPVARRALEAFDAVSVALRDEASTEPDALTVVCGHGIGRGLLPRVATHVEVLHPGVSLRLFEAPWSEVSRRVAAGEADLGLLAARAAGTDARTVALVRTSAYLVSGATGRRFGPTCTIAQALGVPLLAPMAGTAERVLLEDLAQQASRPLRIGIEADVDLWEHFVARGDVHAICAAGALSEIRDGAALRFTLIEDVRAEWAVIGRRDSTSGTLLRSVASILASEAESLGPRALA
jgi:DNA-binding transcriptional LysR family regulator